MKAMMKTMKKNGKKAGHGLQLMLILTLILTVVLPAQAMAAEKIDLNADVSLTIKYAAGETPLVGAQFDLYRVADVTESGEYILSGDFKDYPVSLKNLINADLDHLAYTLSGYASRDSLKPIQTGRTNADGILTFPQEGTEAMKPGMYLVVGHRMSTGSYVHYCNPVLVALPGADAVDGTWEYSVTIDPKSGSYYVPPYTPPEENTVSRKVIKVWDDAGLEEQRPASITVDLLKDGAVSETVTLSASNNWRYTWEGLDGTAEWTVVERKTEGYTVTVSQEGVTYVIKNSAEPVTPDEPGVPTGGKDPDDGIDLDDGDVPKGDKNLDDPKLPQTGQYWWPVGMLAVLGLALITAGLIRRKNSEYEQ